MINDDILKQAMARAEEFFGTQHDPSQIPVNLASYNKLVKLWPGAFSYDLRNNEPVSWVVVVPTSQTLMHQFLHKAITERQLLAYTAPAKVYACLYLCSVFTMPAFRRQGLAFKLLLESIKHAPIDSGAPIFAWSTTQAGEEFIKKLESVLGKKVLRRQA